MQLDSEKPERKIAAFRLPVTLDEQARERCRMEDLTFSQLVRRAVRRELGLPLDPVSPRNPAK
jgi:hypothetical protein